MTLIEWIKIGMFVVGSVGSLFFGIKTHDYAEGQEDVKFFGYLMMFLISLGVGVYGLMGG